MGRAYLKKKCFLFFQAVWSEQYIFNVYARSIFPCDVHGGGVSVLFQYPKCILNNDRVRLFYRARAEVSSLVPPTTLHYVTEQRIIKGKYNLQFDCDYFMEKYLEYCFVYVSQAITGAVSDVRMDCVPTLPIYGWFVCLFEKFSPFSLIIIIIFFFYVVQFTREKEKSF